MKVTTEAEGETLQSSAWRQTTDAFMSNCLLAVCLFAHRKTTCRYRAVTWQQNYRSFRLNSLLKTQGHMTENTQGLWGILQVSKLWGNVWCGSIILNFFHSICHFLLQVIAMREHCIFYYKLYTLKKLVWKSPSDIKRMFSIQILHCDLPLSSTF